VPPREDEVLLVSGKPLLLLDLGLHHADGVRRLHLEGDGLAGERLDEDLHAAARERQNEVDRRLLLDVVVRERAAVLEVPPREDEVLLVSGKPLLLLDLGLHHADGVR